MSREHDHSSTLLVVVSVKLVTAMELTCEGVRRKRLFSDLNHYNYHYPFLYISLFYPYLRLYIYP
jgi:hypothetical protein